MASSESKASIAGRQAGSESLPGLLGRVGEDLTTLLDAKFNLLKTRSRKMYALTRATASPLA
jgi:hypothetical protein